MARSLVTIETLEIGISPMFQASRAPENAGV